jgi:hypothetical protein
VNASNPDHFAGHPLWPHRGYDSDCDPQEYFELQQHNQFEYKCTLYMLPTMFTLGAAMVAWSMYQGKPRTDKPSRAAYIPLALMACGMAFVTCHYQQDITHLCGNIMHHSEMKYRGANETLVETVPHGVLQGFILALVYVVMITNFIMRLTPKLNMYDFISVFCLVTSIWFLWNMKVVHAYVHKHNESIYPFPLNHIMNDMVHITGHHATGHYFGSVPHTAYLHNFLIDAHAEFYINKWVEPRGASEYWLNVGLDYVLLALAWVHLYIAVMGTNYFSTSSKKVTKTA